MGIVQRFGGIVGIVASLTHVVVFMLLNALIGLGPALVAAIVVAVVIAVGQLIRREPLLPTLIGLVGIGASALISYTTGKGKGFFLLGIWFHALLCVLIIVSVLIRRPLVGTIWHRISGDGQSWRTDHTLMRSYTLISLSWAALFGTKFVVAQWLYANNQTGWLATTEILTGPPLAGLALLGTFWAMRRSRQRSAITDPSQLAYCRGAVGNSTDAASL